MKSLALAVGLACLVLVSGSPAARAAEEPGWLSATASEGQLPSPEELRQEAKQSSFAFQDVVNRIDSFRPELRSREQAEPYVLLLADLKKIADEGGFGEIAQQAFAQMATRLTRHTLRWIDAFADSTEVVVRYHAFADEAAASEFLERTQQGLQSAPEESKLELAVETLKALNEWASQRRLPRFLLDAYRETRSEIAVSALRPSEHSNAEKARFWTDHLSPQQGYERYLLALQEWVLTLEPHQVASYRFAAAVVGHMGQLIQKNEKIVPRYTQYLNSDIARELFARMIEAEVPFDDASFDEFLASLNRASLQNLASILISREYIPSSEYAAEYLRRVERLMTLPQWGQITREKERFKRYFEQIASALYARLWAIEGTWRLKGNNGKSYRFNLVFSRENQLILGLSEDVQEAVIHYAFHHVGYDVASQSFVASEHEPDSTSLSNAVIRFRFVRGKLTGSLDTNFQRDTKFEGTKIESYRDMISDGAPAKADGTYEGKMTCKSHSAIGGTERGADAKGWTSNVRLTVTTINGFQMGRMYLDGGKINLTFETGLYASETSAVYLTTTMRSFIHFRAQRVGDALVNGQYIIGGVGLSCDNVKLKRIGDPLPE